MEFIATPHNVIIKVNKINNCIYTHIWYAFTYIIHKTQGILEVITFLLQVIKLIINQIQDRKLRYYEAYQLNILNGTYFILDEHRTSVDLK